MSIKKIHFVLIFLILVFSSCLDSNSNTANKSNQSFRLLTEDETNISFSNDINETNEINYFTFMHLYAGAGVAVGDINNDGWVDIYFNSNLGSNKLYLNKGGFQFEDITESAGVQGSLGFKTGVAMADVNGDGFQDIYVCRSGWEPDQKANLLYVNNGDMTFTEKGLELGLADAFNSTNCSFFDYDRDGDLDVYVMNTPVDFSLTSLIYDLEVVYADEMGTKYQARDHLYENQNGTFVNVTDKAGIRNDLGFGLGLVTADLDGDGWTDIFVGNDFNSPDYAYKNNRDGTFSEATSEWFSHTTFYSMGVDVADINNDGQSDMMILDMAPDDHKRSKITMAMIDAKKFDAMNNMGYNFQYMHNMVQLNNGRGKFSEVSQMCNLDKTDWSWACLMADLDNDGWKDVYVTNGIKYDVTNRDYKDKLELKSQELGRRLTLEETMSVIPSVPIPNYCFRNKGNLEFEDVSSKWGLATDGFSNGAAMADLDNDGDWDIITHNQDSKPFVYENQSTNHHIKLKLEGYLPQNAKVEVLAKDGTIQFTEILHTRGYFSGSSMTPIIGIGNADGVESIKVTWSDGKYNIFEDIKANQTLKVDYRTSKEPTLSTQSSQTLFTNANGLLQPNFKHVENVSEDYKVQVLLPHKQSHNGPFVSKGDANGDGLEDFYVGGAAGQAGKLYFQNTDGTFSVSDQPQLEKDAVYEDLGSVFFDADGDGDLDLFITSGGAAFIPKAGNYQDRLYENDGAGQFTLASSALPSMLSSCQHVSANDFDKDGDIDLFVGGRIFPDHYPYPTPSYLLLNNNGNFQDAAFSQQQGLTLVGMVTHSLWNDIDGDNDDDLILVGEWMPITIFRNDNGILVNATEDYGLTQTRGWWNEIIPTDYDQDGDTDFMIGNVGLNHKFETSIDKPFHVFCGDYDANGSFDVVLAKEYKESLVPVRGRECSSEQMPFIKDKFPTFEEFANSDLNTILGEGMNDKLHYEAHLFESIILERDGNSFHIKILPRAAQMAPVNAILEKDVNKDGIPDYILGGNMYQTEVETSRADASIGCILLGTPDHEFEVMDVAESGFYIPNDVKDMVSLKTPDKELVIVTNNNDQLQVFSW